MHRPFCILFSIAYSYPCVKGFGSIVTIVTCIFGENPQFHGIPFVQLHVSVFSHAHLSRFPPPFPHFHTVFRALRPNLAPSFVRYCGGDVVQYTAKERRGALLQQRLYRRGASETLRTEMEDKDVFQKSRGVQKGRAGDRDHAYPGRGGSCAADRPGCGIGVSRGQHCAARCDRAGTCTQPAVSSGRRTGMVPDRRRETAPRRENVRAYDTACHRHRSHTDGRRRTRHH